MKKQFFCFTLFLLIFLSIPSTSTAQTVTIPDSNLRAAIEAELSKAPGAIITTADMANLTALEARNANISDLNGLEHATNLRSLYLRYNHISDVSALGGLPKLTILELHDNSISDVSALAGLTKLTNLDLRNNSISDVSALSGLTKLTSLLLKSNNISDISALAGLTKLTDLRLSNNNSLSDISTLASLTKLTWLSLGDTSISDISVLSGLTKLRFLQVGNNISDISALAGLTNLTTLWLGYNSISDISALAGLTQLAGLLLWGNNISDISMLAGLTELESLTLGENNISDISPLTGLTKLTDLSLYDNSISDISPLAGLIRLESLTLGKNNISDVSVLSGLTRLAYLGLDYNNISDISVLSGLTKLTDLDLGDNSISDISLLVGLTQLEGLWLNDNLISDISVLSGLPKLTWLSLRNNNISDISVLSGLTNLDWLFLDGNSVSDISVLSGLTNLRLLYLDDNNISDISPLAENTGLGNGDEVLLRANPLNYQSIKTHIPALQSRGITVAFDNLIRKYVLSVRAGISLIHVPLNVTAVNDTPKTITTIADLYDALGGASKVNFLITYDTTHKKWRSYFGGSDRGTQHDRQLTDDMGILANMIAPASIRLTGSPLGTDGTSTFTLKTGLNLVGLPLRDSRIPRVSDLFTLDGVRDNVSAIILTDYGGFRSVGQAGDPGDMPIVGGQSFIMTAQQPAIVTISGDGWYNTSEEATAPLLSLKDIEVGNTTPVLGLRGSIFHEKTGGPPVERRVTVKNLSTGRTVATATADANMGYRLTFVDIETGRAATVGDTLGNLYTVAQPVYRC